MLCSGDRVVVGGRLDKGLLSKALWCSEEVCVCCHTDLCSDGWSERLELGDRSELCDAGDLLLGAGSPESLRVQGCHCDIIVLPCQRSSHWIALWCWCFNMPVRFRPDAVDQYRSLHQSGFRVQRRFQENLQNLLWSVQRQTGLIVLVGLKPDFSKSP